jgi:DNA-binding response OmpR family regulator
MFEVEVAFDAIQGIEKAIKWKPDLVLLDLGLPGGDGYDLLVKLRTLSATCHAPVIVFTARGKLGEHKALKLGAHAYLTKPRESSVLVNTIKSALSASEIEAKSAQTLG